MHQFRDQEQFISIQYQYLQQKSHILGDLALQGRSLYGGQEGEEEQRVPQVSPPQSLDFGSGSDNERILGLDSGSVDSNMSPKQVKYKK